MIHSGLNSSKICHILKQHFNFPLLCIVAHSEVYGYGFRPYEYLPPPNISGPDAGVASPGAARPSAVERQEAALGMYSLRTFLHPKLYMLVLGGKELLGIHASPFLVSTTAHYVARVESNWNAELKP